MNWEMIGAIAQLAAAIGVIPSVIYLAVQIREQNKERRRAVVNLLTGQWSDLVKSVNDSAEFAEIFLRGVRSFEDLDPVSKLRFSAFFTRFFKNYESMFFYHLDGTLDAPLWSQVERTISDYVAYPGVKDWWSTRKHWQTDEFRAVVEHLMSKAGEPTAYQRYGGKSADGLTVRSTIP